MNETVILSKTFISKEMFEKEIKIDGYHFELCGDNDELWLINDERNKSVIKISLVTLDNGKYIYSDNPLIVLEDVEVPFDGVYYFVEYSDIKTMIIFAHEINNDERDIYALNENNTKFISIKQLS
ncbi:MAG: hypothetical protein WCS80_02065 [Bacilli bacterium]